jgi:hypothetical protein
MDEYGRPRVRVAATRALAFAAVTLAAAVVSLLAAGIAQTLLRLRTTAPFAVLVVLIAVPMIGGAVRLLALRLDATERTGHAIAGVVVAAAVVALPGSPGPLATKLVGAAVVAIAGLAGIRVARRTSDGSDRGARSGRRRSVTSWRAHAGEAGVTTGEYIGVLVLVAAMLGAVAVTPIGGTIHDGILAALCRITGGENCGQLFAENQPEQPCVARQTSHTGSVDVSVVIDVGREMGYDTSYLSDATVQVTYNNGYEAGAGVGAGLQAEVYWGEETFQAGGKAEADASLALTEGQVWEFTGPDAEQQAAEWIQWHAVDTGAADAVLPGGRDGPLGKAYGFAHRAGNGLLNMVGLGQDHPPTPPTVAEFYEGGFNANANASGGVIAADANVEAAAARALGYRVDADGNTTVYVQVSTSAGVEGDIGAEGTGGQAGWAADGVMALTFDSDLSPVSAQLTTYRVDEPGLWLDGEADPTAALGDSVYAEGGETYESRTPPSLYQVDVTLDLTDPAQAAAFDDFLVTGTSSLATGTTIAAPGSIVDNLFEVGETTVVEYDSTENNYGGAAMLQAIVEGGGGIRYTQSEMDLANAYYYAHDPGTYLPWTLCTG